MSRLRHGHRQGPVRLVAGTREQSVGLAQLVPVVLLPPALWLASLRASAVSRVRQLGIHGRRVPHWPCRRVPGRCASWVGVLRGCRGPVM